MSWIYNSHTGAVQQHLPQVTAGLLRSGLGWHGPFDTKEQVLQYFEANRSANPGWKPPAGWRENITQGVESAEEVFKGLNLESWLIRVGEILLGIVLIGVGLARITGVQNVASKLLRTATS